MLTRRQAILVAKETTYGTDPAMTGADGILVWDINFEPKGEILERDILRDTITHVPHVIGLKECSLSFKTELKGAGSGSAPEFIDCLSAVGFNTGTISGTQITYALVSNEADMNSASFLVYKDGNVHKIVGARGNMKLNLEAGKYGVAEFDFQGMYQPVAAATLPTLTGLTGNKPPIVYNASFQIGGFSPVTSKADIDLANEIARRDNLNATYGVTGYSITGRRPKLNFDADAVVETSNPFWGDWSGEIVDTWGILIGSTAGNRIKISGYFQYESNKYGDKDGVSKYECSAYLVSSNANTTNDEMTIVTGI
jgi:hypothetical protein